MSIAQQHGLKLLRAVACEMMGLLLLTEGDLDGSIRTFEESLALAKDLGDSGRVIAALLNTAGPLGMRADLLGAKARIQEALEVARQISNKPAEAMALNNLAIMHMHEGDGGGARLLIEAALRLGADLNDKSKLAETRCLLGWLVLDDGRPAEAESLAREAIRELGLGPESDIATQWLGTQHSDPRDLLLEALLQQGNAREARVLAEHVVADAEPAFVWLNRISRVAVLARVRAASGDPADVQGAITELESSLASLTDIGAIAIAFDARLALGEIEIASGRRDAGVARLEELERDAAQRGFGRYARLAARARARE